MRSFFFVTHSGVPQELGVEISEGALSGLPTEDHLKSLLTLHQKAVDLTPFDHISFDWNPEGHPPFFFQLPHFDIHFYMISVAERMEIPVYSPATAPLFENYPPADYMPATYGPAPGGEPMMGAHWSAPPPTFLPFSKVMIYGTFNGDMIFVEPMITLDYLQSGVDFSTAYPQPAKFEEAGYYPTTYNIYTDPKTNAQYISLTNFVWRNAN